MHAAQKILEETQNEFQKTKFNMAYFLPFRKAYDTVSPSLPRARGSLLQRHPWTPRIYGNLNFWNVRVYSKNSDLTVKHEHSMQ